MPRIVELISIYNETKTAIASPALRCIGNIATGTDEHAQVSRIGLQCPRFDLYIIGES